ncbi:MAG: GNAT family N-acetyltransferase [Oscillospiraceae bacterium]
MLEKYHLLNIAKTQLALTLGCLPEQFNSRCPHVAFVHNSLPKSLEAGSFFKAASFAGGAVFSSSNKSFIDRCRSTLSPLSKDWCFEPPVFEKLENGLKQNGYCLQRQKLYFLPSEQLRPKAAPQNIELRWYNRQQLEEFPLVPEYAKALEHNPERPDSLGVAAVKNGNILGLAGASADYETMWQIGIDVLPEGRGQEIAPLLVSQLAFRILELGKIPFYGTAASHLISQNVAWKAGFFPAWAELSSTRV